MAKRVRDAWGSRIGVVLAAAGGAVGLGNFLRFPGVAARNGGGAFMIPYFVAFLFLALPLCWMEWVMGRYGGRFGHGSAPGVFDAVSGRRRPWIKYLGVLGITGALGIFFYYIYIESWTLAYSVSRLPALCLNETRIAWVLFSAAIWRQWRLFQSRLPAYIFPGDLCR